MALTGLVLAGFVLGHMTGNLLVFNGPEAINAPCYMPIRGFSGAPGQS